MSSNNNSLHNDEPSPRSSRVELRVLGISTSQIQSGAYALILAEKNGPRRLPVVVGGHEAQAIAIKLEGIIPPRPMTHDLFICLMHGFHLQLEEVFIHKFEDGVFSSQLTFLDREGNEVIIDARTSDAISLAVRTGCPIFTTREILDEIGFVMEPLTPDETGLNGPAEMEAADEAVESPEEERENRIAYLRKLMEKAISEEAYEEAARLSAEITALENGEFGSISDDI